MQLPNFIRGHKRLSATVAVLIAALAGGWWWHGHEAAAAVKPYTIATASTGDLEETVTAQGTLEPKTYVDVGAQVSGMLQKLNVVVGEDVTQNQLVAEIDPRVYESRLSEQQAGVKSLEAQLNEQQAQLELATQQNARNAQLVASQAVSQDAYDTTASALKAASARVKSLNAQIAQAKSTLSEAQTNLSYTKIFAPISGTVVSQTAREGQTLNANQTAPTVIELANLDIMTVRAQVAEADIGKINAGMKLYFTTLGGEKKWRTTVAQVIPAPQVVNDVVLYNVLADVENPGHVLMDGMSTQMTFVVGQAKDAVLIPVTALGKKLGSSDKDKGTPYQIFVPQGEQVVSRTIQVGLMNRTSAQVLDGLAVGDAVAVPNSGANLDSGNGGKKAGGKGARAMGPRL